MWKKGFAILIGSLFISIGVNLFVVPNHLLDGGILGIGLIAKYLFDVKTGFTIIIVSLPLYVLAFFCYRNFFYNGLHGLFISSFFIDLLQPLSHMNPTGGPIFLYSIISGLFIGTGIGVMLINNISTGATDLLALILSKITKVNAGILIFFIDCIVLSIGWFVVAEVTFFYSVIMVITAGLTTSGIIKQFNVN